jgi:small conductance mechanosensitive channel
MAGPTIALPAAAALPGDVAALPGDMKAALPTLTVMLVNGALALLAAIVILIVGWTLARWFSKWLERALSRKHVIDDTLRPLIVNGVRYVILAVTLVAVLGQFGIQTTSLIALLGAAGLAIGLALQGTLSNVASGVMLLGLRSFRAHDSVRIGDIDGTVREIGAFRTVLVSGDGSIISIPNSTAFSSVIINFSRETARRTDFNVDIDHGSDIEAARRALMALLEADERILKTPAPAVTVTSVQGLATTLQVMGWARNADYGAARADLMARTRAALAAAGIGPPVSLSQAISPRQACGADSRPRGG